MIDPARKYALARLLAARRGAPPRDEGSGERGLGRDLVHGVERHRTTLDCVLSAYLRQPLHTVDATAHATLHMGIFQLLFHTDTPAPLVVASTVELAGAIARRRGFVNAILRRIATEMKLVASDGTRRADEIPLGDGRAVRFPEPVLPPAADDLVVHLAAAWSQPALLVRELVTEFPLEVDALLAALNRPLPLALRTNRRRGDAASARAAIEAAGGIVVGTWGDVFAVKVDTPLTMFAPLRDGLVTVQDVVASDVAPFVGARPGERILDLCAGVGGKALHMAELADDTTHIVAADVDADRLAKLADNARRLGLKNVETQLLARDAASGKGSAPPSAAFDRVLLDVPCSNTAVLMKRPEARWRLTAPAVARLVQVQRALLKRGAAAVKPGGVLVYSTCSLVRAENHDCVRGFLAEMAGSFTLDEEHFRVPHRTGRDGGYMARMIRRA